MSQALISIIVPMYNEVENVQPIYRALKKVTDNLNYKFEMLFVDDGSSDGTTGKVEKVANKDPDVVPIELSRNFGKEVALTAGLREAKGDAAIMIDADLQHPPQLIPEFIEQWEKGADLVVGVRKDYKAPKIKKAGTKVFYSIMKKVSDTEILPEATDYRLVDKQVVEEFNKFTEHNRITRGLFDWLGFNRDFVYFNASERKRGQEAYSFRKLFKLAIDSITGHSLFPLKLAGYIGVLITLISLPLGIFVFIDKFFYGNDLFGLYFSGNAILAVISLFLSGIMLVCIGFIALYIANIHQEVINRPLYVTRVNGNGKTKGPRKEVVGAP